MDILWWARARISASLSTPSSHRLVRMPILFFIPCTASAMAAGALVALRGGTGQQIGHAVAMALKNLMGLVCDPVAGLVEVPCVKRNVIGAVNAVSVADMAMAGITSRIPVDEVIDAMGEVGRRMPVEFRETALGGLAVTPTGKAINEKMRQSRG